MRFAPLCLITCIVVTDGGCALTSHPSDMLNLDQVPGAKEAALKPNVAAQTFQKIKQAKRERAVVLQVDGDPEPVRVLPLPEAGQSVFVSDLLTQTGVFRKFGRVEAELFRDSTNLMDGVRMKVDILDGDRVTPGTDYALRPGDRLRVRRATTSVLGQALGGVVPRNTMRGLLGFRP